MKKFTILIICAASAFGQYVPPGGGGTPSGAAGGDLFGTYPNPSVGKLGQEVSAGKYGCVGNGSTDNLACVNNALAALVTAGGGTLVFPPGRFRINGQVAIPNDSGSPVAKQVAMRITGAGSGLDTTELVDGAVPTSGTILDIRYSGSGGKILTLGGGILEIDHLALVEGAVGTSVTTPFVYTTNTNLQIHDDLFFGDSTLGNTDNIQDAIVLGGTTATNDNTLTSAFGGYGTVITRCVFSYIQRIAFLRVFANGIQVTNNFMWPSCGSSDLTNGTALEIQGGVVNYVAGNVIGGTYKWGIRVNTGVAGTAPGDGNSFIGNSFNDNVGMTAAHRFEATVFNNFYTTASLGHAAAVSDPGNGNPGISTDATSSTVWSGPWRFNTPVEFTSPNNIGIKVGEFISMCFTSGAPSAGCVSRFSQWGDGEPTLDDGTLRHFIPLRFGKNYSYRPVASGASTASISATDVHNTVFYNTASYTPTLPDSGTAVVGTTFTFYVDNASAVTITANTGQTIQVGAVVSSSGGNISNSTVGSTVTLLYVKANTWVAIASIGVWVGA